ncbi:MAG: hypothetical protein MUF45_10030 [Spirosomaceae bacterium]|jgi:hypothetical protein|nr:hypothetical protein [Spirosomataceae bacterium]
MKEHNINQSKVHKNAGRRTKEKEKRDNVFNFRCSDKTLKNLEAALEYFIIKAGHANFTKTDIVAFAIDKFQEDLFKELNNIS